MLLEPYKAKFVSGLGSFKNFKAYGTCINLLKPAGYVRHRQV